MGLKDKPTVIVEVQYGLIETVYTNIPGLEVHVLDLDVEQNSRDTKEENDELRKLIQTLNLKKTTV